MYLSKCELPHLWQVRFFGVILQREMRACFEMQVHFGFCFTRYSRIQRLPGLICLEVVLSMAQGLHHLLVFIVIVISIVGDPAIPHAACG